MLGQQKFMARPERFERPTPWFVAKYSIQLSYGRVAIFEAANSTDLFRFTQAFFADFVIFFCLSLEYWVPESGEEATSFGDALAGRSKSRDGNDCWQMRFQ